MKRLLTLMLACAAILVMGITAATVSARDGSDDDTAVTAQPCDDRQGENEAGDDHGTDSRAIASDDREGTSRDDDQDGTSEDDHISGHDGDDDERGDDGDDDLQGDDGDDDLCGDDGDDHLRGGAGDDVLKGGRGDDSLNGGKGHDEIEGDSGNDVINSRDGQRDVVTCGRGRDRVRADKRDRVSRTCESVKRS
jgi:Ca2+-binding RTX toxin-like protein